MTLTPEELLVEMTALWGEEDATTIWLFLDQRLAGRRLYWPQRAGRLHRERCIYEAVARRGRRPEDVAAHAGVSVRTVRRIVSRTLDRIRARK